jgi:hypothetical protein
MYRTTDIRDRGFAAQRNRQMMNQRVRHLQDEIVETTQIEQTVFSSKVMQNMVNITKTDQDIDEDQGRAIDLCGYWMGNYGGTLFAKYFDNRQWLRDNTDQIYRQKICWCKSVRYFKTY